jgi:PAS domain-containing protein
MKMHPAKVPFEKFISMVVPEDRTTISNWFDNLENVISKEHISCRIFVRGNIYYINLKCNLSYTDSEASTIFEGIIQNVTELHKRRNDINTLTHVIFNVNELIFGANEDGTLKFANQNFRRLCHIGLDEDISLYKIYDMQLGFVSDKQMWESPGQPDD